jgi:hypothetical protein
MSLQSCQIKKKEVTVSTNPSQNKLYWNNETAYSLWQAYKYIFLLTNALLLYFVIYNITFIPYLFYLDYVGSVIFSHNYLTVHKHRVTILMYYSKKLRLIHLEIQTKTEAKCQLLSISMKVARYPIYMGLLLILMPYPFISGWSAVTQFSYLRSPNILTWKTIIHPGFQLITISSVSMPRKNKSTQYCDWESPWKATTWKRWQERGRQY